MPAVMPRFLFLSALILLAGLAGCSSAESHPPEVPLRTETAIERRATFSILRRAWEDRPQGASDDHCWYERRLLNRSGVFGKRIKDTETYVEACQFWMRCVREHLEVYDDENYRPYRRR